MRVVRLFLSCYSNNFAVAHVRLLSVKGGAFNMNTNENNEQPARVVMEK